MSNLICGKAAVGGNDNLTHDNIGLANYDLPKYTQVLYECPNCTYIGVVNPIDEVSNKDNYASAKKYEGGVDTRVDGEIVHNFQERAFCLGNAKFQKTFIEGSIDNADDLSVLDVGSSTGYLLYVLEGRDRLGIDPSRINQIIAKKIYDIEQYVGTFEEWHEENARKQFDIITISHVLEHINDPLHFLKLVKAHAVKYVFIEVPTTDCRFEKRPFDLFIDEHISYFSLESLKTAMRKVWGETIQLVNACVNMCPSVPEAVAFPSIMTLWGINMNEKICSLPKIRRRKNYLKDYYDISLIEIEAIRERLKDYLNVRNRIAIYCAGAHTNKFFGMGFFEDSNVICIYDGNVYKQGKTINQIPIKKFDYGEFMDDRIDYIVVCTNNCQNEIYDYLLSQNVPEKKIVKIYD